MFRTKRIARERWDRMVKELRRKYQYIRLPGVHPIQVNRQSGISLLKHDSK